MIFEKSVTSATSKYHTAPCSVNKQKPLSRKIADITILALFMIGSTFCLCINNPETAHAENVYVNTDVARIYYGGQGYYTHLFEVDGHPAYCAQPDKRRPLSGIYKKQYLRNDAIAAALYFGYGGPGWDYAYSHGWWPSKDYNGNKMTSNDYYVANHILLSYLYGGWGAALYETSQDYKNWASNNLFGWVLTNLRKNINQVPDAFKKGIYWVDSGYNTDNGVQGQDFLSYNWIDAGGIRLRKSDAITGSPIRNIQFDIYNSNKQGQIFSKVGSITTNERGEASTRQNELPVGWYVLKEVNPPANCKGITSYPLEVRGNYSFTLRKAINGAYSGSSFEWATFTNRATTQIEFTKKYGGAVAPSTKIELYRNGSPTGQIRTINRKGNDDTYSWGFYDLDKYDSNGRNYVYSVKEVGVANNKITLNGKNYQVTQSGNIITNIELRDLNVKKEWNDSNNKYGLRPSEIKVTLKRRGSGGEVDIASAILSEKNGWTTTWHDLPVTDTSLELYHYRVEEEPGTVTSKIYSSNYNASNGTITNTLVTTSVKVNKSWHTKKNAKPSSITLHLMNGSQEIDSATIMHDGDDWSYTFESVPKYDINGNEISYSLIEDDTDGYVHIVDETYDDYGNLEFNLVNISTETIDIPVEKRWSSYVTEPSRPSSVTISLYADGMPTGKTLNLTSASGWKGSFVDLPRYSSIKNGAEIEYSVRESPIDQYAWEVTGDQENGYIVTNNYGTTSVPVKKVWTGENGNTSRRPASVTIKLIADGKATGKTISLSSSNNWSGTFTNLPKYNEQGNDIIYTVSENAIGFYMSAVTGDQVNGFTVTNKYAENETSVRVIKSWDDKDNEAGLRPDDIQVALKKQTHNGAQKLSATANPNTVYKKENITINQNEFYVAGYDITNKKVVTANQMLLLAMGKITANSEIYNMSQQTIPKTNTYGVTTTRINLNNTNTLMFDDTRAFSTVAFKHGGTARSANILRNNGLLYMKMPTSTTYWYPTSLYVSGSTGYLVFGGNFEYYSGDGYYFASAINTKTNTTYPTTLRKVTSLSNTTWYSGGTSYTYGRNNNSGSIYLNVPAGGSSFYPTATANARHALSFYYTAASDTTVNIKMQSQTGYWNEGSVFATFTAKKGTHYYTITQNATNTLSGKTRLDFLDGSGSNLNGNVADLSMWNTAAGMTTVNTGKTATLSLSNNWSASFESLPRFDTATNAPIEYIIEEAPVDNYTPSIRNTSTSYPVYSQNEQKVNPYYSYNITNTLGELRDIPVSKIWNDNDNLLKYRPSSIFVALLANGADTGEQLELNVQNNWSATFEDLPSKASDGTSIKYTISESRVPYYAEPTIVGNQDIGYTIENTLPIISVPVSKEWLDMDNSYSTRPKTVTVRLLANGEDTGKQLTLSDNNNWQGLFSNLAVYDSSGAEISYAVAEDAVDQYRSVVSGTADAGYTVTNTLEKMKINVAKEWDTVDGQPGVNSLEINLFCNGEKVDAALIDESNNWSCVFENLDVYDKQGNLFEYTVAENPFNGSDRYDKVISGDIVSGFTIRNVEKLSIPVYKTWEDYDNVDELRPDSIFVRLLSNGEYTGEFIELSENNDWQGEFKNLPRYDENGSKFSYSIEEDSVPYYASTIQGSPEYGFTITNSHDIQFTTRSVSKIWDDNDNIDGIRPDSVIVRLFQNGDEYRQCELSESNGWNWIFEKLPITDELGNNYIYTIAEDTIDGYDASYVQDLQLNYTITNHHEPTMRNVTVEKQWSLSSKYEDKIPDSIIVNLFRNNEKIQSVEIMPDDNGRWQHEFTKLPIKDPNGEEYQYSVNEEPIINFGSVIGGDQDSGFVIINHYLLASYEIEGMKFWIGDNSAERPEHITVQLLRNEESIDEQDVRPNAFGQWHFSFGELPFYDPETGEEYMYEIVELPVNGYEAEYGYTDTGMLKIVNRATKSIPVEKIWNDNNNVNGSRPSSIKVNLIAKRFTNSNALIYDNGKTYDDNGNETTDPLKQGYRYSLDPSNDLVGEIKFNGTVQNAVITARSEDGTKIYFTQDIVANGIAEPISFDVGSISDRDAIFEIRDDKGNDIHEDVVSLLLHDSQYTAHISDTLTLTAQNNWKGSFDDVLERDNKGFLISYEVQEEPCYGYASEISGDEHHGYEITNSEVSSISVSKKWISNGDASIPDSIDVKLLQNGIDTGRRLTLRASDNWKGSFDNIAWRDSNGKEYEYAIEEMPVDGWISHINNNIRDSYSATIANYPTIDLSVEKHWEGDADHLDSRPDAINTSLIMRTSETIELLGELSTWEESASSFINSFTDLYQLPAIIDYSFKNANSEDAFIKIDFVQNGTIKETQVISVPANDTTTGNIDLSMLSDAMSISISISGTNASDSTTAKLAADGKLSGSLCATFTGTVGQAALAADNEWKHVFEDLPTVDEHGNEINYDIVEDTEVPGYASSISRNDNTFIITNTFGKIDIPVRKIWIDMDNKDGLRPNEIQVNLLANEEQTGQTITLSDKNEWSGVFTLLDVNDKEGNAINYSVMETTNIEGYTTTINGNMSDGFEVRNIHDIETEISVTKIWNDTDNIKKIRPEFLIIHLYADGSEIASARLSGRTDTWEYTFSNLPYANDDGTIIEYTIAEDDVPGYTQQLLQRTEDEYVIVNWTPAPLVELPFSGSPGIWIGAGTGLLLCLIVLSPYIRENIRCRLGRKTAKQR